VVEARTRTWGGVSPACQNHKAHTRGKQPPTGSAPQTTKGLRFSTTAAPTAMKSTMEKTSLVLTCIGEDREGLVEALSEVVQSHQGNWQESRMARLGGRFLRVVVETTAEHEPLDHPLELELIGLDRPGIVFEISRVLRSYGVNVEELDTTRQNAPQSGELLFQARASLRIPPELDPAELFAKLEAIAGDLMVDVLLEPPED